MTYKYTPGTRELINGIPRGQDAPSPDKYNIKPMIGNTGGLSKSFYGKYPALHEE